MLSIQDSRSSGDETPPYFHHTIHGPTPPLPRTAPYEEEDIRGMNRNGYNYDFLREINEESQQTSSSSTRSIVPEVPSKNTFTHDKEQFIKKSIAAFEHGLKRKLPTSTHTGYMSYNYTGRHTDSVTPMKFTRTVNIFGWNNVNPLTHKDYENLHVFTGDPYLMELLNVLGNVFLQASTQPHTGHTRLNPFSYNTFSPYNRYHVITCSRP